LRFLQKARRDAIQLCTSTEVLQEILYRYAGMDRLDLADQVYELFVQQGTIVFPVPSPIHRPDRARTMLRAIEGLSVRDAVHAAVMLQNDVSEIATFDRGFDTIPAITRLDLAWVPRRRGPTQTPASMAPLMPTWHTDNDSYVTSGATPRPAA
jgi:hypothetical protein